MIYSKLFCVITILLCFGCVGNSELADIDHNKDSISLLVKEIKSNGANRERRSNDLVKLLEIHCVCGDSLLPFWGNNKVLSLFPASSFEDVTDASALPRNMDRSKYNLVFWAKASFDGEEFVVYTAVATNLLLKEIKTGKDLASSEIVAFALFDNDGDLIAHENK